LTRRSFIKWIITSGAAMACPIPMPAFGADADAVPMKPGRSLSGESNEVCHKVRDGITLPAPPPSRTVDIVVVGAGPGGVGAADALAGSDFLVLEKEPRIGGNAYAETWNGLSYCTGSAWMTFFDSRITELFKKWKLKALPIDSFDSANFEGKWIKGFWDSRADSARLEELPYPDAVKKGFRDFLREIDKIDINKNKAKLDALSFGDYLKGKPEPLSAFLDQFGLSNWGAPTQHSSAFLGIQAARDWPRDPRFTFEGGLGVVPQKVYDQFPEEMQRRFILEAPVYRVKRSGKRALVYFFKDGKPACVEAKAVIFCAPKLIAARVVEGLPESQKNAMQQIRYAPYPVYNLCFTKRVCDLGYDSYLVGAKNVSDLIQADWVTRRDQAKPGEPQVLTAYAPMRENERADLLDDEETLARAERAVKEVLATLPGAEAHLAEVRVFRRGHPMPMALPGVYTKLQPLVRKDFAPVYFAHSDQAGEVSDLAFAVLAGLEAAKKALKHV
jgi:monoamine oxidase